MKKLTIIICIIVTLVVLPILGLDFCVENGFLTNFFKEQAIPLMGTILALNLALAASLQAILLGLETQKNISLVETRKEVKENVIFMITVFVLVFILQIITPEKNIDNKSLLTIITGLKLLFFFLYLYAVYEISNVLFQISSKND